MRVFYEVYGDRRAHRPAVPDLGDHPFAAWKMQIPYFARHCRVVTFDRRGNGRSDRPGDDTRLRPASSPRRRTGGAGRNSDARARGRRVVVRRRRGPAPGRRAPRAGHGPGAASRPTCSDREPADEERPVPVRRGARDTDEGWAKWNRHYWLRDWPGFLEFFFSQMFTEPHSTKQIEDAIGWGLETDPQTLIRGIDAAWSERPETRAPALRPGSLPDPGHPGRRRTRSSARRAGPPWPTRSRGELVTLEGSGHAPHLRDPVSDEPLVRDFACPRAAAALGGAGAARAASARCTSPRPSAWATPSATSRSPANCASCILTWRSTGSPSTRSPRCWKRAASASTLPAPTWPASPATSSPSRPSMTCTPSRPSGGWTRSCSPTSWSSMTSPATEDYDLWIGDESWELDYYLHENPEQKTAAYAWLTDFVGWLPMADGGAREALLTADYNAEMIEHIARYPRVRDSRHLRGRPRRHRPGHLRPRAAADPRLDRAALRLRRLHHRLRPAPARGPGSCSATARTSASAS